MHQNLQECSSLIDEQCLPWENREESGAECSKNVSSRSTYSPVWFPTIFMLINATSALKEIDSWLSPLIPPQDSWTALSSFPLDLHKQELFIYLLPLTIISLATIFLSFKNIYIYLFGCAGSSYLWLSGSSIFALGSFQLWHVGFLVAAELFIGACGV